MASCNRSLKSAAASVFSVQGLQMYVRDDRVLTRHRSTHLPCPKSLVLRYGALQATFQESMVLACGGLRWAVNGMLKIPLFAEFGSGPAKSKTYMRHENSSRLAAFWTLSLRRSDLISLTVW